jgi:hypothetical protein
LRLAVAWCAALAALTLLPGCTAIAVTGTAVSVTASAVGLAASAAVGTVKVAGKGIGMAADALGGDDKPDASGIVIRESVRDTGGQMPRQAP